MSKDFLGDAMRARLSRVAGRVPGIPGPSGAPDGAPPEATAPAETVEATEAPVAPVSGVGGGVQTVTAPEGERWDDEMRRRAFGG